MQLAQHTCGIALLVAPKEMDSGYGEDGRVNAARGPRACLTQGFQSDRPTKSTSRSAHLLHDDLCEHREDILVGEKLSARGR